jgi:hypothetical protein
VPKHETCYSRETDGRTESFSRTLLVGEHVSYSELFMNVLNVRRLWAYTGVVPIKDTPYLEECCQVLTESKEAQTDAYLVNLVRLQMIVERIRPVCSPADGIDQPLTMYIQMIHREMQIFKQNLPSEVGQNSRSCPYSALTSSITYRPHPKRLTSADLRLQRSLFILLLQR